jgi:hypothetical protein
MVMIPGGKEKPPLCRKGKEVVFRGALQKAGVLALEAG